MREVPGSNPGTALLRLLLCDSEKEGLFRELNPGPLAPEARTIPLDQTAIETKVCCVGRRPEEAVIFSTTPGNLDQREPLENDDVDVIDTVMTDM